MRRCARKRRNSHCSFSAVFFNLATSRPPLQSSTSWPSTNCRACSNAASSFAAKNSCAPQKMPVRPYDVGPISCLVAHGLLRRLEFAGQPALDFREAAKVFGRPQKLFLLVAGRECRCLFKFADGDLPQFFEGQIGGRTSFGFSWRRAPLSCGREYNPLSVARRPMSQSWRCKNFAKRKISFVCSVGDNFTNLLAHGAGTLCRDAGSESPLVSFIPRRQPSKEGSRPFRLSRGGASQI